MWYDDLMIVILLYCSWLNIHWCYIAKSLRIPDSSLIMTCWEFLRQVSHFVGTSARMKVPATNKKILCVFFFDIVVGTGAKIFQIHDHPSLIDCTVDIQELETFNPCIQCISIRMIVNRILFHVYHQAACETLITNITAGPLRTELGTVNTTFFENVWIVQHVSGSHMKSIFYEDMLCLLRIMVSFILQMNMMPTDASKKRGSRLFVVSLL